MKRRDFVGLGAASLAGAAALPDLALAQMTLKITVGYIGITAGLPLYLGIERGLFQSAGVTVEAVKFADAQKVVEALLADRIDACATGTASANIALAELASPGLTKILACDESNIKNVLDEVIVARSGAVSSLAQLSGKKVGCGTGAQQRAIATGILAKNGVTNAQIVELAFGEHISALSAGQLDAAYTLEPTGTIGRLKGITRTLEAGVFSRYLLGNSLAPRFGGSAAISTKYLKSNPAGSRKFIEGYRSAVKAIRGDAVAARKSLRGYTPLEADVVDAVPLPSWRMYDDFHRSDLAYFQQFLDFFAEQKLFSARVPIEKLMLHSSDLA